MLISVLTKRTMSKRIVKICSLSDLVLEMHFLGTSTFGESIVLLFKDKKKEKILFTFLIDSFSGMYNYLKELNSKESIGIITCICWTHPHKDHTDNLIDILKDPNLVKLNKTHPQKYDDTTRFFIPPQLKENQMDFLFPTDDSKDILELGGALRVLVRDSYSRLEHYWEIETQDNGIKIPVSLHFLTPPETLNSIRGRVQGQAFNHLSLSFVLEVGDFFSSYFGGDSVKDEIMDVLENSQCDTPKTTQKKLSNREILAKCTIVKIPHHGSRTSEKVIKYLSNLSYAITTSDSRRDLPSTDVIRKYKNKIDKTYAKEKDQRVICTKDVIKEGDNVGVIKITMSFENAKPKVMSVEKESFNFNNDATTTT